MEESMMSRAGVAEAFKVFEKRRLVDENFKFSFSSIFRLSTLWRLHRW